MFLRLLYCPPLPSIMNIPEGNRNEALPLLTCLLTSIVYVRACRANQKAGGRHPGIAGAIPESCETEQKQLGSRQTSSEIPVRMYSSPTTHSLTHPPTHSLTQSFTHYPLTHPHTHSLTHPLTHSPIHPLTHPHTHSLTHPLTHSPIHPLTHSLTHSLTQSFTISLTSSLTIYSRYLLGRHKAALDTYTEALSLSPQEWVSQYLTRSGEEIL